MSEFEWGILTDPTDRSIDTSVCVLLELEVNGSARSVLFFHPSLGELASHEGIEVHGAIRTQAIDGPRVVEAAMQWTEAEGGGSRRRRDRLLESVMVRQGATSRRMRTDGDGDRLQALQRMGCVAVRRMLAQELVHRVEGSS